MKKLKLSVIVLVLGAILITGCKKDKNTDTSDDGNISVKNYLLVATGQTSTYNNAGEEIFGLNEGETFYGQDGNYQKGGKMSFTNNGDGTITDNITGLMWQEVPSTEDFMWADAEEYCNNLSLGGYSDWRMPTVKELFSLQDFSTGWPYIQTEYFRLASGEITKDEQFWTSTKYVGVTAEGGNDAVFGVNAVTGHIKAYASGSQIPNGDDPPPPPPGGNDEPPQGNPMAKYVRAVRGDTYGINNLIDNGDGTITDKATNLMWAQADNGEGIDWENALAYAENSSLAGHTDWRLPNVKELQSIVDYSYSTSAADANLQKAAIDPMFSCTTITNEAGNNDYGYYWTSTSARFQKGTPYYYAWYVAFGQAVNNQGADFHGAGAVRFDTKYKGGEAGEGGERYFNFVRLVRDAD